MTGTVKALILNRLYGFLRGDDSTDYFFHISDLADGTIFEDLRRGDSVEFSALEPRPQKGPRATNIMLIETANEAAAS